MLSAKSANERSNSAPHIVASLAFAVPRSTSQNTGTAPISSIRMFNALQGLGKEAALYLYPYEDHSVMTYESDLDQWARWVAWFDVHIKNAKTTFTP